MRMAAFEHVRGLHEVHDQLTANEFKPGFVFDGERIPLINPQRGHFQAAADAILAFDQDRIPETGRQDLVRRSGARFTARFSRADETVDYAFMGENPEAADNRWLREAFENQIPVIYFLGIAPGRYQAMLPAFISGWDAEALKARVAFGVLDQEALAPPGGTPWNGAMLCVLSSNDCTRHRFEKLSSVPIMAAAHCRGYPNHCSWTQRILLRTRMNDLANR